MQSRVSAAGYRKQRMRRGVRRATTESRQGLREGRESREVEKAARFLSQAFDKVISISRQTQDLSFRGKLTNTRDKISDALHALNEAKLYADSGATLPEKYR